LAWSPGRVTEFDVPFGRVAGGLFENELEFGTAAGGGEFMLVGALVRLVAVPVPVLYWSPEPPWSQPARANPAHKIISVLFMLLSYFSRLQYMQLHFNIQARAP
jgi:hypothetical protein